jgi:alpha-soluble NSF attachment protein
MASNNDARAQECAAKAQKLLKKSFFHSADHQGAADMYEKAANLYKLDKAWEKAGEMLEKMAECQQEMGSTFSAGRQYQAAAMAYKNGGSDKVADAWNKAISLYVEDGKFSQAGKAKKELAEVQEAAGDITAAYDSLTAAIDFLETAHEPVAASQLKSKAAHLAVDCGEFQTASDLFESVARNVTIATSAVEPFFKAALCHLVAGDAVASGKCLQQYASASMEFARSEEFTLVDELVQALETSDLEAFQNAIKKYDPKGRKFDAWKKRVIAGISAHLPKEDDVLL